MLTGERSVSAVNNVEEHLCKLLMCHTLQELTRASEVSISNCTPWKASFMFYKESEHAAIQYVIPTACTHADI